MEADSVKYSVGSASNLDILAGGTTTLNQAGTSTIVHKDGQQRIFSEMARPAASSPARLIL